MCAGPLKCRLHLHTNWSDDKRSSPQLSLNDAQLCSVSYDWHLGIRSLIELNSNLVPKSGGLISSLTLHLHILVIPSKHGEHQDLYDKSFLDNMLTLHNFFLMMNIIILLWVGGTWYFYIITLWAFVSMLYEYAFKAISPLKPENRNKVRFLIIL